MKTRVLVFPDGEINSVELHAALSHNVNIELYGATSIERHGQFVFKNHRAGLPSIVEPSFILEFNKLLDEWNIDVVIPTHDSVALFFANHIFEWHAKVVVADKETAAICRDKMLTYKLFETTSFCPILYDNFITFPCFIKPKEGQGSQGAKVIYKKEDIPNNIDINDYVISEYLPGEELTVDCLTDSKGRLVVALPRRRNRMMAGVCVSGESIECSSEILSIATQINDSLQFLGLWYFQVKQDANGDYKLLEISTRCAGTMCLSRARGVNLPLLSIYAVLGYELTVIENPYTVQMDRTLISRYKIDYSYSTVYVDYDDTIIEKKQVCLPNYKHLLFLCKHYQ